MWLAPGASSRELNSSIYTTETEETKVWLAPDATSVQLKGSFDECKKHIPEDCAPIALAPNAPSETVKGESKSGNNESVLSHHEIPTRIASPNHLGLKYAGLKLDTRQNDDPVRSAPDTVSTATASQAKFGCKVNENSKDEISLGAWSFEVEDPGISGISSPLSNASVSPAHAPKVNDDASKIAPETVSEESDDDDLPNLI
jgi:hypothetical protein